MKDRETAGKLSDSNGSDKVPEISVALLTGGGDKPYVFGLVTQLIRERAGLDVIGSNDLDFVEFHDKRGVSFFNLRGDQEAGASVKEKVFRVAAYYFRLVRYAGSAKPRIFHILWNNKFQTFDRTVLTLYYRLLGKRVVLTVHNVNAGRRDFRNTRLNRFTLRIQYRLADHIFVHTEKMKLELIEEFGVEGTRVTVIPFGINNSVPNTALTRSNARLQLGIRDGQKAILFFGNIAPYKGLEYLISAFQQLRIQHDDFRLIIAGRPKNCDRYWMAIRKTIDEDVAAGQILLRTDYIPDEETEVYFKAADVLALPYRHIYQSGVLFLGYSFGLPALVADVGSLKEEVVEGKTGFVFRPEDPNDLASAIERYFTSDLFAHFDSQREQIRSYAMESHSWDLVGQATMKVYRSLLENDPRELDERGTSNVSLSN